jgi:hypothetical protein
VSVGKLGGNICSAMRHQAPSWGAWWLDAEIVDEVSLTTGARVTAELGGRVLQGTIVNGYAKHGAASYRVVGGAGGLGRALPAKPYHNDAGVKLSTVVGDAVAEAGETITGLPTTRLGAHYARDEGPLSALLNRHFPRGWYVADDGTITIGQRSAAVYVGDGARVDVRPGQNTITLDVEALDNLAPGVTIDGSDPATDIEVTLTGKSLRVRVYASTTGTARRQTAFAKLLAAHLPDLRYRGAYEFRVASQDGERFNLEPVLAASGLPDLLLVPVRGPAGFRATVQVGELVVVTFINAQPDRPAIIGHDDPEAPGFTPLQIDVIASATMNLDAGAMAIGGTAATLGAARMTDPVVAGPFSGTIVNGSATVKVKS